MATATVNGALLGWVVQRRINQFRRPPSGIGSYAVTMVVGALVANAVVAWDNEAHGRNPEKKKKIYMIGSPRPKFRDTRGNLIGNGSSEEEEEDIYDLLKKKKKKKKK